MQWFTRLETNDDPITACRLMNVFRRKGLRIVTLSVTAQGQGFAWTAVLDFPEAEFEHLFNFLRGTQGVESVSWQHHVPDGVMAELPGVAAVPARTLGPLGLPDYPEVQSDASFPADFSGLQPEAAF